MFGLGMHPRSLVHVTELEEGVCDGKTQFRAEREQSETATIHVANTMMTDDTLPCVVISADPGIEVVQQYDFVVLRNPSGVEYNGQLWVGHSSKMCNQSPFLQGNLHREVWFH